jgi:hypothetical protein
MTQKKERAVVQDQGRNVVLGCLERDCRGGGDFLYFTHHSPSRIRVFLARFLSFTPSLSLVHPFILPRSMSSFSHSTISQVGRGRGRSERRNFPLRLYVLLVLGLVALGSVQSNASPINTIKRNLLVAVSTRVPVGGVSYCTTNGGQFALVSRTSGNPTLSQAATLCPTGYKLADVVSATWTQALSVLYACAGANHGGWIHSWNGDNYRQPAIELRSGQSTSSQTGSVVLPYSATNPSLCQGPNSCTSPPPLGANEVAAPGACSALSFQQALPSGGNCTTQCAAGYSGGAPAYTCTNGAFGAASASCQACPAGSFSPAAGSALCLSCPANFFSGAGSSACTPCPAGLISAAGASVCSLVCPTGFFKVANSSVCIITFAATGTGATGTIQTFTASVGGLYGISAYGASGNKGSYNDGVVPGVGIGVSGVFNLTAGQTVQILVGQQGQSSDGNGGGGGGSFIVAAGNIPLLVAGGGGGLRQQCPENGGNGQAGTSGGNPTYAPGSSEFDQAGGVGGTNGSGGTSSSSWGGGGGGLTGDGQNDGNFGQGGRSFIHGGAGGLSTSNCGGLAAGGFGGGGSGNGCYGGGGGGGYSGGAGGWGAGGGGSYCSGNSCMFASDLTALSFYVVDGQGRVQIATV